MREENFDNARLILGDCHEVLWQMPDDAAVVTDPPYGINFCHNAGEGREVEISISPEMIERVLADWEQEHPGRRATLDMGADEFARRMMIEVTASARMLP